MTPTTGRLPRAELRILRLCTGVVGAGTLAATVATSFVIAEPNRLTSSASPWLLTAVAILLPLLAAGSAPWSDLPTLRWLNALVVVEYAALLALLALGAASGRVGDGDVPWLLTFTALPVAAALIAWGPRAAWIALLAATAAVQGVRALVGEDVSRVVASDVQAFFASLALVLLFGTLVGASRDFDRSTEAAYSRASQRSGEEARTGVRRRLQALVHDEVLSILVLAAHDVPALRDGLATRATRARRLVRELHEPDAAARVATDTVVEQLRDLTADETPDASFRLTYTRPPGTGGEQVGFDAAEALAGALRQALVNSRTHAGAGATRSVQVTADADGLEVVITDDGVGFDPAHVPPTRLGISTSIVGRLRSVAGGAAVVQSTPGAGTRVVLRLGTDGAAPPAEAVDAPAPAGILPADDRGVRRGLVLAVTAFWVAQAGLAVLAARIAGDPWVAALALGGVGAAFVALGWSSLSRPSTARGLLVAAITVAVAALSLVPVPRDEGRYGDTWYVAACGFVLLVLAVRGRPGLAVVGGLTAIAVALAGAGVRPNDVEDVLASVSRHATILLLGGALAAGIARTQARTARLRAEELALVRREAFREAAARELRVRTRTLEDTIGRMLERLESGAALSEQERRECAALDGRLRDQYRGGRIVRPPVIEAAMAARRRGVDVVLLDDAPDRTLSEHELDAITRWLGARLDAVAEGRFTGRILPGDRGALASAVAGDEAAELAPLR